jgi:hypothetical protein
MSLCIYKQAGFPLGACSIVNMLQEHEKGLPCHFAVTTVLRSVHEYGYVLPIPTHALSEEGLLRRA